jgi:hypothetical protein
VLDGVWLVRTSNFKNLLEVVFVWSGAPLEIVFGCCHELLIRDLDLFPGVTIAAHYSETMWAMLLPLLSTIRALFGGSYGGTGGRGPATAGGHTHTN